MRFALVAMCLLTACGRDVGLVRKWLADWETARACMFSAPEYGPDTETALLVSSLLENDACNEELRKLIRVSDADSPSIPNWNELRRDLHDGLLGGLDPAAIDRIDARVTRMRAQVGLPPLPRTRERAPTRLPAGTPIPIGPQHVPLLRMYLVHELEADIVGETETRHVEVFSPDDIRTSVLPNGYVLAYPSRGWSAKAGGSLLSIVDIDGKTVEVPLPHEYWVSRAMDRGASHLVVLQARTESGFAIAISTAGGPWTVERSPHPLPLVQTSQDRETGIVEVVVESEGHAFLHRIDQLDRWRFPERVEIPKVQGLIQCRHNSVLWITDLETHSFVVRITPPTASTLTVRAYPTGIADCRDTSALILRRETKRNYLVRCRGDDCKSVLEAPYFTESGAVLLEDGTWLYAAQAGSIVGVWREGKADPAFYRLHEQGQLVKVVLLKGAAYLLVLVDGTYQLVALPAA